jgi:tRNA(Ile)-lysidine synthase
VEEMNLKVAPVDLLPVVKDFMERNAMIDPGGTVLVAVSGGPDSVALLHVLHRLSEQWGFSLGVAHLNHMFRSQEAEGDSEFVRSLANSYGLPTIIESVDVPLYSQRAGLSAQTAAREIRYRFLNRAATEIGAGRIALAHHADDQTETILMNFIRGAGLEGLKGIMPVRNGLYIRPMLQVRRKQIEDYCKAMDLSFRVDRSNSTKVYLRNLVRLELMPLLRENYNSGITEALLRQREICLEEDSYLEEQAEKAYLSTKVNLPKAGIGLDLKEIRQMPKAILRRVLRLLWQELTGSKRDISFVHVEEALGLLAKSTGARIDLPGGVTGVLSYTSLDFSFTEHRAPCNFFQYPVQVPGETFIPEVGQVLKTALLHRNTVPDPAALPPREALLDFAKLPSQLYVRQRLPGDRFQPYGQQAEMKLKSFLSKQKIPRAERDKLPLLCSSEEIIWVAGLRVSDKWKVAEDTEEILHVSVHLPTGR